MSKLRPQRVDWDQIHRFLERAAEKLRTAKRVLGIDEETAYQMAYDAMLKASLAFLLSRGLRPRSLPGHHVAIIEYVEKSLGPSFGDLLLMFDRMRRKRNQAIYDASGLISKQEAGEALEIARKYLAAIGAEIQRHNPQHRLK